MDQISERKNEKPSVISRFLSFFQKIGVSIKKSATKFINRFKDHVIPGEIADALMVTRGCAFAPRCAFTSATCRIVTPENRELAPGRQTRCHHPLHVRDAAA